MAVSIELARHGWEPVVQYYRFSPDDPEPPYVVAEQLIAAASELEAARSVEVVEDEASEVIFKPSDADIVGLQIWGFSVSGQLGPSRTQLPHRGGCPSSHICGECGADCGTSLQCPQCGHDQSAGRAASFNVASTLKKLHAQAATVAGIFTR